MNQKDLMKCIAQSAYNIGYGAKVSFSTYDIVEKTPGRLGFVSIAIGIFSLVYESLTLPGISASMTVLGVASLYISFYTPNVQAYEKAGVELTQLFHQLQSLYNRAKATQAVDELKALEVDRLAIVAKAAPMGLSKQIFLSTWYAHYKFFWQSQTQWVSEELGLTMARDKLPLSFTASVIILATFLVGAVGWAVLRCSLACPALGLAP